MSPIYGQVVIGPPGSGKTTYCNGMQQYLRLLGRNCYVVNLDPANEFCGKVEKEEEGLPYEMLFDICEVVYLSSVMEKFNLGPNGGLLYCMEYVQAHWKEIVTMLESRIEEYSLKNNGRVYILFDLPGQVELYTHCSCIHDLFLMLVKKLDMRLCVVQLLDSLFCLGNPERYISGVLWCMSAMIRLELPSVNVLSKIDLLQGKGHGSDMVLNMDFFLECDDMTRLVPFLDIGYSADEGYDVDYAQDKEYQQARNKTKQNRFHRRHEKLHQVICEVIEDYSLVKFLTLDINDVQTVARVAARVDKANGYVFVKNSQTNELENMFHCAIQNDTDWKPDLVANIQERFYKEEITELKTSK